ncbi:coiled-coil domain-containing protein 33-like [Arapaima gigas]
MAEDNLTLRRQVGSLQSENKQLCSNWNLHSDLRCPLLDNMDIDIMTNAEIADHIACLKFMLASESIKVTMQKDKIQQLQNELIRKYDFEKKMLQLHTAHQQQQYQSQSAGMVDPEAKMYQQGKDIEKMEQALNTRQREIIKKEAKQVEKQTVELAADSSCLMGGLEKMQPQSLTIQQPAQANEPFSPNEKLNLLVQLERAQTQIRILENQVDVSRLMKLL